MDNKSFLTEFIMVTNIKTILFLIVLVGIFYIIKVFEKKKIKFSTRTIYSMIIGLVLGIVVQISAGLPNEPQNVVWMKEVVKWYSLFGSGFMDLLKMLVVPLVFTSILRVIINMDENENLGKLTYRTLVMLLSTTGLAAIVGITVANIMKLGVDNVNVITMDTQLREITPLVDTLRGLLPSNIVTTMANGNIVGIIIFAVFIGLGVKRQRKKYSDIIKPFENFVEAFYKIIISVAMSIIKLMPYAVVPMIANTIISSGISSILSVLEFIVALYISVGILFIIHLLLLTINKINPIKYVKNASEVLILAFTSRSSLGTLPVTIKTLRDKQGVDESVASFTSSLGANMGMNGCAGIYPALVAVTLANMAGVEMNISFYVSLFIVIIISSLGIAGLPGTATMAISVVLSGVGLDPYFSLIGGIIAIDPILDMGRTMINVNGASTTAIIVAKSLGKLNNEEKSI
ncbi:MAG: cation:dicarboxylate symporter family transporter [Peptostreptococcaceae bacterium]